MRKKRFRRAHRKGDVVHQTSRHGLPGDLSRHADPDTLNSPVAVKLKFITIKNKGMAMTLFIMLTRLTHGALQAPQALEQLEQEVKHRIREHFGEAPSSGSPATPSLAPMIASTSSAPRTLMRR